MSKKPLRSNFTCQVIQERHWSKKAAKIPTDLTEDVVRQIGLATGMVDVKICAVDEKWSGLKFVYRRKNRPAGS
jgi:hypothetical protein